MPVLSQGQFLGHAAWANHRALYLGGLSLVGWMLCCCHLAILHNFWTKGSPLSFWLSSDDHIAGPVRLKDICREIKTFEFIRGSYFIWKPSYIFLSICSCIILSDFSNYGNRTIKIQTAVHTLTPFLKEKNNKLVISTPKKRKQRQHVNFLCVSYPWHVSLSSLPKVI